MRIQRKSANKWRDYRRKKQLPNFGAFVDHLEPAVILSLNTGIRRGELLALRWAAIDMVNKILTIEGIGSKTKQTRHMPLNAEAMKVLERWKKQTTGERLFPFSGLKTAWNALLVHAEIKVFRWHDMRHDFASRLASKGIPLNTIRELLGHQSLAMTLRYAHLQPDQKAAAVAQLVDMNSLVQRRAAAKAPAARRHQALPRQSI